MAFSYKIDKAFQDLRDVASYEKNKSIVAMALDMGDGECSTLAIGDDVPMTALALMLVHMIARRNTNGDINKVLRKLKKLSKDKAAMDVFGRMDENVEEDNE